MAKYFALIILLSIATSSCGGYETESSHVISVPEYQQVVVIRSSRAITVKSPLINDMTYIAMLIDVEDKKTKAVVTYSTQMFRGFYGAPTERFLPDEPFTYFKMQGTVNIPKSPAVKKITFLVRNAMDKEEDKAWRVFEYKDQDWTKTVVIPPFEQLPLCSENPNYTAYPAMINEAKKLQNKLNIRAWYDNI